LVDFPSESQKTRLCNQSTKARQRTKQTTGANQWEYGKWGGGAEKWCSKGSLTIIELIQPER